MRTTHHDRHRCAQNADHLTHNRPFSAFFAEVVCTLGTIPPQTVISPSPNGGNGVIRGTTRRRHAANQLLMLQNPHRRREGIRATGVPPDAGPDCGTCARRARLRHPWTAATPPPPTFRMQFPHDTNRCTLKNRRISTIRFQHLKYTQGNCMRNYYGMGGAGPSRAIHSTPGTTGVEGVGGTCRGAGGRWRGLAGLRDDATNQTTATQPHWCGGRRRDRRARAGFEARRRTK